MRLLYICYRLSTSKFFNRSSLLLRFSAKIPNTKFKPRWSEPSGKTAERAVAPFHSTAPTTWFLHQVVLYTGIFMTCRNSLTSNQNKRHPQISIACKSIWYPYFWFLRSFYCILVNNIWAHWRFCSMEIPRACWRRHFEVSACGCTICWVHCGHVSSVAFSHAKSASCFLALT